MGKLERAAWEMALVTNQAEREALTAGPWSKAASRRVEQLDAADGEIWDAIMEVR